MKNRTNKILELLTSEKRIEVSQLAEYLGVSQVTIRKDLDALEAKGIIKREHGHAVLCSTDDINGRIAYHYEEKKKIALKATELVNEGDTIMIESGSCCALLADTLTQLHKERCGSACYGRSGAWLIVLVCGSVCRGAAGCP